jgi:outer membrane receptor protein involved in Fe transport
MSMSWLMSTRRLALLSTLAVALPMPPALAQTGPAAADVDDAAVTETIQVTATRVPEDVEPVPASVTVISGDELRARGVTDLPSALANVAGVSIAPGGDAGPAGSVPEIWGLREFDAFLLVVDGVPAGGAFNPALPTLDLTDVDRIEIMRGAAPVLYGATSFVGVIHVIHRQAGTPGGSASAWGGNYSSGGAAVSLALPAAGAWSQSLTVNGEKQGFKDDRTEYQRAHVLYRGAMSTAAGALRLDFDATGLRQDPASPHVREGRVLSSATPLDANYNPSDAHQDQDRYHLALSLDRTLGGNAWSTTLAVTHTSYDTVRGFLLEVANDDPNANGFEQDLKIDDVYFDTHLVFHPASAFQVIAGFDHLYGKAKADSEDFDYFVPLSGRGAPSSAGIPRGGHFDIDDKRNFSGLYAQGEWTPNPRFRVQLGARVNHTVEEREAGGGELGEEEEGGTDDNTITRGSGMVGLSYLAWQSGTGGDGVWVYGDARDTFKPAALDFGPEAEPDILDAETARSYEAGLKGRHLAGRFGWEVSAFQLDFENLVVAGQENGLPALINAGSERFKGVEVETDLRIVPDLLWRLNYAWHSSKFVDSVQLFDGVPTQLAGRRLEMAPEELGSTGLIWAPAAGFNANVLYQYVGDRFLNKRNTALSPSYETWEAGIGYRFSRWAIQLQGENLNDVRPPVAESELGDAQYYRLPARTYRLGFSTRF